MREILVIHGPNLNLLGKREPDIYGAVTLEQINTRLEKIAKELRLKLVIMQSNHEGEIVSAIGSFSGKVAGILINPAAYTHTSVAIRDALGAASVPSVEVHLSNIHAREEFRRKSLISGVVSGQVSGFGASSYELGLIALSGISAPKKKRNVKRR